MKKRSLLWFFWPVVVVIIIIVVVVVVSDDDDDDNGGGSGVSISTECDFFRQRCIDLCLPNYPMCVENCNNEAEACRSNQSTQGLEQMVEQLKNERNRQAHNLAVAQCRDRCYENAFSSRGEPREPGEPEEELTLDTFLDPEFQELLRNARLCAHECGSYQ